PGRVVLTPEEVAEVWKGKATRGVVGGIREQLKNGTLIPGLKKTGGRWVIPVSDLIKVIDGLADDSTPRDVDLPQVPSPTVQKGRKKAPIPKGRLGVFDFWSQVFHHLEAIQSQEDQDFLREG